LNFFERAKLDYYGTPEHPKRPHVDSQEVANPLNPVGSPLFDKQAIIILREELEYFPIPPKRPEGMARDDDAHPGVDAEGYANQALADLKRTCGKHLLGRRSIFTALQRNVNREKNLAEQHLIDMLCMRSVPFSRLKQGLKSMPSGFDKDDEWGYRALEPNRCCITSIALVLLKTGITFPERSSDPEEPAPPPQVNSTQFATAHKLLLFWRKPAVGLAFGRSWLD
jgi:hypothetical protein